MITIQRLLYPTISLILFFTACERRASLSEADYQLLKKSEYLILEERKETEKRMHKRMYETQSVVSTNGYRSYDVEVMTSIIATFKVYDSIRTVLLNHPGYYSLDSAQFLLEGFNKHADEELLEKVSILDARDRLIYKDNQHLLLKIANLTEGIILHFNRSVGGTDHWYFPDLMLITRKDSVDLIAGYIQSSTGYLIDEVILSNSVKGLVTSNSFEPWTKVTYVDDRTPIAKVIYYDENGTKRTRTFDEMASIKQLIR